MTTLKELPPRNILVGNYDDRDIIEPELNAYYAKLGENLVFSSETPHSPERTEELKGLRGAIIEWGADLGFNLDNRVPSLHKYHFLVVKKRSRQL